MKPAIEPRLTELKIHPMVILIREKLRIQKMERKGYQARRPKMQDVKQLKASGRVGMIKRVYQN
jgi:hypothetical protein